MARSMANKVKLTPPLVQPLKPQQFHSTAMASADPYTDKASQNATPQEKLDVRDLS